MSVLKLFDMQIICKYFRYSTDFINIMKVCKKYKQLVQSLRFNPIRLTKLNFNLFKNIETQYIFTKYDFILPEFVKKIVMYRVNYQDVKNNTTDVFKNVNLVTDDAFDEVPNRFNIKRLMYPENNNIKKIAVPNSYYTVNDICCNGLTNLESIVLPNGLTKLSVKCFMHCTNLNKIVIPNSVLEIGDLCFMYCKRLKNVNLPIGLQIGRAHV